MSAPEMFITIHQQALQNPTGTTKFETLNTTWGLYIADHQANAKPSLFQLGIAYLQHIRHGGRWPTMSESEKETFLNKLHLEMTKLKSYMSLKF